MKIQHICPKCTEVSNNITIEIDEGFFKGKTITCSNGHELFFISKSPRFQYLLQQGIESYLKEFYFECFLTLYSAYEAYKKEFVAAHLYNETNNIDAAKNMLTKLDRSERLEGAYISSFVSLSNGIVPNDLSRSAVELRNNVVHKGVIPDQKSCLKIGNAIFKLIGEGNLIIANRCMDNTDAFPITQVYENDYTKSILEEKGFDTTITSPDDFANRNFIDHTLALNILSPMTLIEERHITTHMFADEIEKGNFLIS